MLGETIRFGFSRGPTVRRRAIFQLILAQEAAADDGLHKSIDAGEHINDCNRPARTMQREERRSRCFGAGSGSRTTASGVSILLLRLALIGAEGVPVVTTQRARDRDLPRLWGVAVRGFQA